MKVDSKKRNKNSLIDANATSLVSADVDRIQFYTYANISAGVNLNTDAQQSTYVEDLLKRFSYNKYETNTEFSPRDAYTSRRNQNDISECNIKSIQFNSDFARMNLPSKQFSSGDAYPSGRNHHDTLKNTNELHQLNPDFARMTFPSGHIATLNPSIITSSVQTSISSNHVRPTYDEALLFSSLEEYLQYTLKSLASYFVSLPMDQDT